MTENDITFYKCIDTYYAEYENKWYKRVNINDWTTCETQTITVFHEKVLSVWNEYTNLYTSFREYYFYENIKRNIQY